MKKAIDFEDYISNFPDETQSQLRLLRTTIKEVLPPLTQETISYGMPAFKLNGILLFFAAYKSHIGFYPTSSAIKEFSSLITKYKVSKGTIQFPLDKPLPLKLIQKIVKFRVNENLKKVKKK